MGLPMYEAMLNLSQQPKDRYVGQMQALIDARWDNTITVNTIGEADAIGSLKFTDIEARVSHMVAPGTVNVKNGDDFKKITFKDIDHYVARGMYYQFDDNYWITTFTDNIARVMKNTVVRRCNNTLRWRDKDDGRLISYPCVLDYEASAFNPLKTKDVITPNNTVVIIVQGNADTHKLVVNQRFIFNKRPFKITGYNNYMQNGEIDDSTTILYFDAQLDSISPFDDLENSIANANEYIYTVDILQGDFEQAIGYVGVIEAEVRINGEVVDKPITWESNEFATITQDGIVTLTGEAGDVATIVAKYSDFSDSINISIVSAVVSSKEIVVNPQISTLLQNRTVDIYCNVYDNDILQPDIVTAVASGVPMNNYEFDKIEDNHYRLKNIAPYKDDLVITFHNGTMTKTMNIKLGGIF